VIRETRQRNIIKGIARIKEAPKKKKNAAAKLADLLLLGRLGVKHVVKLN
jgi:hypothetical protein